jgi:predicted ATPase
MQMRLQQVGPLTEANLTFADLTVFVGPQASAKSIALQFLKLMVDTGYVQHEMRRHGLDWRASVRCAPRTSTTFRRRTRCG